ncbi:MAG: TIGR02757 family protein [Saprospiraceae bacterium]
MPINNSTKEILDFYYNKYNNPDFIIDDPISIPHRFSKKQDIEIAGFLTSVIAWGRRSMIIKNANRIIELMDDSPYDFIMNHMEHERLKFTDFKHRTFQPVDALYFIEFLQYYYKDHDSLEEAFTVGQNPENINIRTSLENFHDYFFDNENSLQRTKKHIPTPKRKSTCKRINMFLRWMVRNDDKGVDFGIWNKIKPADLMIPIDVHVERIGKMLGLLERKQRDWQAVEELTDNLRLYDPEDPVKYDFALFGYGVMESKENQHP